MDDFLIIVSVISLIGAVVITLYIVLSFIIRHSYSNRYKEEVPEVTRYAVPQAFDDRIFLCRTVPEAESVRKVIESNLKIPAHFWQPQEIMQLIQLTKCKTPAEDMDTMHSYYALRYMESLVMLLNRLNNELIGGNEVEDNTLKRDIVHTEICRLYGRPLGWVREKKFNDDRMRNISDSNDKSEEQSAKDNDRRTVKESRPDAISVPHKKALPGSEEDVSQILNSAKINPPSTGKDLSANKPKATIDADNRLLHDLQQSNAMTEGKKDPPREWTKGK